MSDLRVTFIDHQGREVGCVDTSDSFSQRSIAAFKRNMKDAPNDYRDFAGCKPRFEAI